MRSVRRHKNGINRRLLKAIQLAEGLKSFP